MTSLSLKTKMTLAVSLLTAVLLSILAFSVQIYFVDHIKKLISDQQFTMLSALAEQVDDKLVVTHNELIEAASTMDRALLDDPARVLKFFRDRPDTLIMFDNGLFLFSPQGIMLSGNPRDPSLIGRDFSRRDYLKKTLATRRGIISDPFISSQAHGHPILMFTAPIFDKKGTLLAILAGSLDLTRKNFLSKLAAVKLGERGYMSLFNSSRILIAHKDPARVVHQDAAQPGANPLFDRAVSGFEGTGETVNSRHTRVISSFKKLKSTGWILSSNFPLSEVYAPVYRMQRYLLVALLAVFSVSFLVVWFAMKRLTAPLISFTRQIRAFTSADSDRPRITVTTGDEIGVLGETFNLLLDALQGQKNELKKQLEFSQTLIDSIPIPVFYKDGQGRYLGCNKAFEEVSGYAKGQMVGKTVFDIQPPGISGLYHQTDQELLQINVPLKFETEAVYADASKHSVIFFKTAFPRADGSRGGVIAAMLDITERKLAEEQLLKLSQAVMQSPVPIIISDAAGKIEFVNPMFTQLSGYQAAEVLGKSPSRIKSGKTRQEVYQSLWSTISSGRVWSGDLNNRHKNGTLYWVHSTISPIRNSAGAISHYMAFLESMTDRKQLEEQLRQAQKMEAIGKLAGGVAHDFNNILTVIMGFGQLLAHSQGANDPGRAHLKQILDAAERASHLTGSLLAFSRKQVMQLEQVELNAVARNHTRFLARIIGEDIALRTDLSGVALPVLADSGQLEQVFMNLATNARDAMPGGGELWIRTRSVLLDEDFYRQHGYGSPGRYALVTVSDSGCGMDAATQEKIFEPFFTTKASGRGTGLGLSIVYGIIKQHGGHITLESGPGQGTSFGIYLPLSDSAQQEQAGESEPDLPRGGKETILVVEDDPMVRNLVDSVLQSYGYRVILARDGEEALELFAEHWHRIDLALLDVILPRMNGRQLCETLRERAPRLKVLFLTGYTADVIEDRGILVDGIDLLLKPAQPVELAQKIRDLLDGR